MPFPLTSRPGIAPIDPGVGGRAAQQERGHRKEWLSMWTSGPDCLGLNSGSTTY